MPDIKLNDGMMKLGALVVGLALAWAALDARSQAASEELQDHETRIRTLERDVMPGIARIEQRLIQLERAMQ
jgi:hypothetical protein